MSKVKAAEAALGRAVREHHEARTAFELERDRRRAKFEEDFAREMKNMTDEIARLRAVMLEAERKRDEARVEAAAESTDGYPVGTRLVEWKRASSFYARPHPLKKTGRIGVVQIWTRGTAAPSNTRWGMPSPGTKYIRLLKKDGTESLKYETFNSWGSEWHPEGVEEVNK